jgi:hypothetical protein
MTIISKRVAARNPKESRPLITRIISLFNRGENNAYEGSLKNKRTAAPPSNTRLKIILRMKHLDLFQITFVANDFI